MSEKEESVMRNQAILMIARNYNKPKFQLYMGFLQVVLWEKKKLKTKSIDTLTGLCGLIYNH